MLSLALLLAAATPPALRAVVTAVFEGFNRHDADAMARLYAPDALLASPDFCAARGRDDVARTYRALFAAYPDIRGPDRDHGGGRGSRRVRFVATSRSGGLTLPVQAMIRVRDGLIVENHSVFDTGGEPCQP